MKNMICALRLLRGRGNANDHEIINISSISTNEVLSRWEICKVQDIENLACLIQNISCDKLISEPK